MMQLLHKQPVLAALVNSVISGKKILFIIYIIVSSLIHQFGNRNLRFDSSYVNKNI